MKFKILLVDDDHQNLFVTKRLLEKNGYDVHTVGSGAEAIDIVRSSTADYAVILMDYRMADLNGATTTARIREIAPSQQIIAYTIDDTKSVMKENFQAGAIDVIDKNASNDTLLNALSVACKKYEIYCRTINSASIPRTEREEFIQSTLIAGRSIQTYDLCKAIRRVAPTDSTVLIRGETGTGKEEVAKALHKLSARAKGPFIAFNVAAEQASLIDSSLFGHKKGSFTGAVQDQPGKFSLANRGTIFLDEIGDLTLDLQVKLLRVIQEREVIPIGATRPLPIDVRIIAATHRNLEKLINQGLFREDLYFRLNTVTIETIPLRDRPDDIEPLIEVFTDEFCKKLNVRKRFNRQCLEILRRHKWAGNVRALRSMVERHFISCDTNEIYPKDLDRTLFEVNERPKFPMTMEEIDAHVDNVKRSHLERIIRESNTYAEVARRLKVTPSRLHYFLNKFRLGGLIAK
jgi:DNA-binding NtrC family response regulator